MTPIQECLFSRAGLIYVATVYTEDCEFGCRLGFSNAGYYNHSLYKMSVDAWLLLLTCYCHSFLFLVHTHISVFELYNVYSS